MKVLDVGCGAGHFYPFLKKIVKNMVYHGVDISDRYVDIAKKLFSGEKNASFSKGDIENLDASDNSYDVVICYQVLPFIPNYQKAVEELMRVAKKHIFIRLLLSDYTYIIKIFKKGFKKGAPYEYYNIYSEAEFLNYLKKCGAREVKVFKDGSKVKLRKKKGFPFSTYTYGKLEIIGNIVLTWKVVHVLK